MPKAIKGLADEYLTNPAEVSVAPVATTVERVEQRVTFVNQAEKTALLTLFFQTGKEIERTLVFSRTKHGADKVVRQLAAAGIPSSAIHGNKSQPQREKALDAFRDGSVPILIATDIAARGIDIPGVSHVVNYDLPNVPEQYVHRIGRTARAGADGIAIAYCDREEKPFLKDIEKLTRNKIDIEELPQGFMAAVEALKRLKVEPKGAAHPQQRNRRNESGARGHSNDPQRYGLPHKPSGLDHGLAFDAVEGDSRAAVQTRLVGEFNASNLVVVLAGLRALSVPLADAAAAASALTPVPGRLQRVTESAAEVGAERGAERGTEVRADEFADERANDRADVDVVVDYAHTPDAVRLLLDAVRATVEEREITTSVELIDCAFLGCSLEGARLFGSTLRGCKLTGSTFLRSQLRPLTVQGGDWSYVALRGAGVLVLHDGLHHLAPALDAAVAGGVDKFGGQYGKAARRIEQTLQSFAADQRHIAV